MSAGTWVLVFVYLFPTASAEQKSCSVGSTCGPALLQTARKHSPLVSDQDGALNLSAADEGESNLAEVNVRLTDFGAIDGRSDEQSSCGMADVRRRRRAGKCACRRRDWANNLPDGWTCGLDDVVGPGSMEGTPSPTYEPHWFFQGGDVAIEFAGDQHRDLQAGIMNEQKARPEWQRTYRCKSNKAKSCKECSDDTDCFTGHGDIAADPWTSTKERVLVLNKDSTAKKYLNTIHLSCPRGSFELKAFITDLRMGTLRIFFDGIQMTDMYKTTVESALDPGATHYSIDNRLTQFQQLSPITEEDLANLESVSFWRAGAGSYTVHELKATIFSSPTAAHELSFEYIPDRVELQNYFDATPSPSTATVVNISELTITVDPEFGDCQDTKACLEILGRMGEAGKRLRQSNKKQLKCLREAPSNCDSTNNAACCQWRQCLERFTGEDHMARIINLLIASGVGNDPGLIQGAENAISKHDDAQSDSSQCVYPPNEDPESWDCDCYEAIETNCNRITDVPGYSIEHCTRAIICLEQHVCQNWKDAFCHEDWLPPLQAALEQLSLLQHAQGNNEERAKILNEATASKSCGNL